MSPNRKKAFLLLALFATAITVSAQHVQAFVRWQMETYPQSRLLDFYKSCFQDYMGAEHLVTDRQRVKAYMDRELAEIDTTKLLPWYVEPCGIEGRYVRVSLKAVKEGLIDAETLLDAFVRSANAKEHPSVQIWEERWHTIVAAIDSMDLRILNYEQDKAWIDSILSVGEYAISHSSEYREAYHPHYRIVERGIFEAELRPLMEAVNSKERP